MADAGSHYTSPAEGFAVDFPFPGPPTIEELPPSRTALGNLPSTSHYVRRGETAFDVTVLRYPPGSLAKDVRALLEVERNSALQAEGARLVRQRWMSVIDPDGVAIQALELEVAMPKGMKVLRVSCFVHDWSYTFGAGGPASDDVMNDDTFRRFVESVKLLPIGGPTTGDLHVAGPKLKPGRPGEGLSWDRPRPDAGH